MQRRLAGRVGLKKSFPVNFPDIFPVLREINKENRHRLFPCFANYATRRVGRVIAGPAKGRTRWARSLRRAHAAQTNGGHARTSPRFAHPTRSPCRTVDIAAARPPSPCAEASRFAWSPSPAPLRCAGEDRRKLLHGEDVDGAARRDVRILAREQQVEAALHTRGIDAPAGLDGNVLLAADREGDRNAVDAR